MPSPDKLIEQLNDELLKSTEDFAAGLPAIERQMYSRVIDLLDELERSNGRLKVSAKNIRIIGKIRRELNKIILTPAYRKKVEDFAAAFEKVEEIQIAYFDAITAGYTAGNVMKALKEETLTALKENMLDVGISYNVSSKIADTLRQQITSGGKYSDLLDAIRQQMVGDGQGALQKYAGTYANDALYTYSRQYNEIFTEDLGIEFYRWVGPLKKTSRPFCVAMEENTRPGGCLEYIHVSQFPELLNGHVCGDKVAIYEKTGLPEGFKKNTTTANFVSNAGGWNCQHQLIPVPDAGVPEKFRAKFGK